MNILYKWSQAILIEYANMETNIRPWYSWSTPTNKIKS